MHWIREVRPFLDYREYVYPFMQSQKRKLSINSNERLLLSGSQIPFKFDFGSRLNPFVDPRGAFVRWKNIEKLERRSAEQLEPCEGDQKGSFARSFKTGKWDSSIGLFPIICFILLGIILTPIPPMAHLGSSLRHSKLRSYPDAPG